jgi:tetratricopeptide (TPR) repeat protein
MSCKTLCLVLLLASCLAPIARAQEPEAATATPESTTESTTERARVHFQKGVDYYAEGDLTAAMVELQRAYEIEPSYRLLYNLAQVSYEQREYAAAERFFQEYLTQGQAEITPERRSEVELELERLKGRVANVRLGASLPDAQLFVDGHVVGRAPLEKPIRVSAGRRTVRAELPGHTPVERVIDVVGGEPLSVQLDFPSESATAFTEYDLQTTASDGGTSPALWTGIATGVLGLGAAGMAIWTASDQQKYDDAIEGDTTRSKLDELADSTEQKALITDVLLGATIVGAAVTVILLLTDSDDERPATAARIQVGPGSVRATF